MTQEQKNLLLKDLCSRLPYGVKVQRLSYQIPLQLLSINPNGVTWVTGDKGYPFEVDWTDCKLYLFPFSMTEEQKKELNDITNLDIEIAVSNIKNDTPNYVTGLNRLNWLLKNHFDIYDLIPLNLAEDATGKNIY